MLPPTNSFHLVHSLRCPTNVKVSQSAVVKLCIGLWHPRGDKPRAPGSHASHRTRLRLFRPSVSIPGAFPWLSPAGWQLKGTMFLKPARRDASGKSGATLADAKTSTESLADPFLSGFGVGRASQTAPDWRGLRGLVAVSPLVLAWLSGSTLRITPHRHCRAMKRRFRAHLCTEERRPGGRCRACAHIGKAVRQAVKVAGDKTIRFPVPPFIEDQSLLVS